MNNDIQTQQTTADEQQLADLLAQNQPADNGSNGASGGLQFEETPVDTGTQLPAPDSTASGSDDPATAVNDQSEAEVNAAIEQLPAPTPPTTEPAQPTPPHASTPVGNLDSLKKDALEELRPLVDKLDLPADEKFDTLLLIIRSTDDQSLLAPAHEAAKAITDDTKRAQALLDVIKEIDFFSQQK